MNATGLPAGVGAGVGVVDVGGVVLVVVGVVGLGDDGLLPPPQANARSAVEQRRRKRK